jgi:hypothetical protein
MWPVPHIELWDSTFLTRLLKRYPNLVGSYFGTQLRDHLFPNLSDADMRNNLSEIRELVEDIKMSLHLSDKKQDIPIAAASGLPMGLLSSHIIRGVEGYFKDDQDLVQFHGDSPHSKYFSFKYSTKFTAAERLPITTMLSIALTPEEAIDIEAILVMDHQNPVSTSTYWSHDIFITHISGPSHMISLPSRGVSFMFACDSNYDELRSMVSRFLDNFADSAVAARRERVLQSIAGGVPLTRALLLQFKYGA